MLRVCELVFDDVIQGTTAVYTDPTWNERMGVADTWAVFSVSSQVSGTTPTLTVAVETSGDGVNWFDAGTAISAYALSTTDKTLKGSDPANNGLRFVRLKITLGGTGPSARVQLWYAGRDFTK